MGESGKEGMYMVTKIISGDVIERRKSYITRRPGKRGNRQRGNSSERKIVGNRQFAILDLARKLNCNFHRGDVWLTCKFDAEGLERCGGDFEGARRAGRNFVDRLARRLKKHGAEVKWVLAASEIDGETGELVRPHVHLILRGEGFAFADGALTLYGESVDAIWGQGSVDVQFLRAQKDFYPLAKYIIDQARGVADEKKYTCSRNLKKPIVERHVVLSGAPLRIPAGGVALPGTRIDLERGQNVVRYLRPARKDPARKIGGRKEMALALSGDEGGGEEE